MPSFSLWRKGHCISLHILRLSFIYSAVNTEPITLNSVNHCEFWLKPKWLETYTTSTPTTTVLSTYYYIEMHKARAKGELATWLVHHKFSAALITATAYYNYTLILSWSQFPPLMLSILLKRSKKWRKPCKKYLKAGPLNCNITLIVKHSKVYFWGPEIKKQ